jgi:hypothetical protein
VTLSQLRHYRQRLRRECKRKHRHHTFAEAEAARVRSETATKQRMHIYECPHCRMYHLTKRPRDA